LSAAVPVTTRQTATGARPLRPRFTGAVRGELLKLRRQRALWVMLSLASLLFLIVVAALLSTSQVRGQLLKTPLAWFYLMLNIFLSVFDAGAGIFLLIVSARLVAMEYSAGTIRVLLGRGTGRLQLLFAKLVSLYILGIALLLAYTLATGIAIYGMAVAWEGGASPITSLPSIAWHNVLVNLAIALISIAVNILIGMTAAVVGRSLAFGLGAAIAFFPADNLGTIVLGLLGRLTGQHFWLDLTSYLLGPNLNVLQQVLEPDHQPATAFARPLVPVHGTHALLLIGAYALVFLAVSLILTRRRDVLQ
jgi:ABC-type transport system involved in multi-copper enzyme maturation permease subunit